jgi:hypothetical protein
MTNFFNSNGARFILAAGLLLGMISTASAYTAEQQQLCTDDAFRLCGADIPVVDRVTACMVRHKTELSPGCKSVFRPGAASAATPTTPAAPTQAKATKSSKRARKPVT